MGDYLFIYYMGQKERIVLMGLNTYEKKGRREREGSGEKWTGTKHAGKLSLHVYLGT